MRLPLLPQVVLSSNAEDGAISRKTFRPAVFGIVEHYNQEPNDIPSILFQAVCVTFENGVIPIGQPRASRTEAEADLVRR